MQKGTGWKPVLPLLNFVVRLLFTGLALSWDRASVGAEFGSFSAGLGEEVWGGEFDLPLEFRDVGSYQLSRQVKLKEGRSFPVLVDPMLYRVYTDGVTVRLYGKDSADGFTAFTIYRNDGVMVRTREGIYETVAGVQAHSMVGNVLRQLTLTQRRLTLTKFPALSDLVQITYAERVSDAQGDPSPATATVKP